MPQLRYHAPTPFCIMFRSISLRFLVSLSSHLDLRFPSEYNESWILKDLGWSVPGLIPDTRRGREPLNSRAQYPVIWPKSTGCLKKSSIMVLQRLLSESLYGWQSVSISSCRPHFADVWPDIASFSRVWVWNLLSCLCGAPSLTKGRVCPQRLLCGECYKNVYTQRRTHYPPFQL
jgi:hypothetical protein